MALAIRYLSWFVLAASMFVTGLYLKPQELKLAFKRYRLIIRALIANAIIIPLIGLGLYSVTPMEPSVAVAFLMVTFSFGVPLAVNFVRGLRADIPFVTILIFCLALVTSITMPILLNLVLPISFSIRRSFLIILAYVIFLQLLPLLVGSAFGTSQTIRMIILRPLALITGGATFLLGGVAILQGISGIPKVGLWPIVSMFILILSSIGVGWITGGPNLIDRKVIAVNSSLRNFPVGLLLATSVFFDPVDELAVAVFSLVMLLTVLFFSRVIFRLERRKKEANVRASSPNGVEPKGRT